MPRAEWADDLDVLDAIELALTKQEREVLHRQLDASRIDRDAWLADVPALRNTFGMFAAMNLLRRFEEEGCSREEARARAAARLGIPAKTLENWQDRWTSK